MSEIHLSIEQVEPKETYETPEMIVYGDVETLTRGTARGTLTTDIASNPGGYPSKVRTPTPPKKP